MNLGKYQYSYRDEVLYRYKDLGTCFSFHRGKWMFVFFDSKYAQEFAREYRISAKEAKKIIMLEVLAS